jgi:hypothetical protein
MIGMYAIIAFALIGGGVAAGIVVVVSLGIRREEKGSSLMADSPGLASSGGWALMAVYSRGPGVANQIKAQREDLADAA